MIYQKSAFIPLLFQQIYGGLRHFLFGLVDVRGRTGRLHFWLGMVFASLLTNAAQWLGAQVMTLNSVIVPTEHQWSWAMLAVWLALTLPLIARRFNDMGLGPAFALFAILPPFASLAVDRLGLGFAPTGSVRWFVDISNLGWVGLIMVLAAFIPLLAPSKQSHT